MADLIMDDNELAEIDGGPMEYEKGVSIFGLLEQGLRKSPNEPAVIVMYQPPRHLVELVQGGEEDRRDGQNAPPCLSWTFNELNQAACRIAFGMTAHGVKAGSTIVTLIPNCVEWFVLQWVSALMKLTSVSLDPAAVQALRKPELESYMKLKPDAIVVATREGAVAVDQALGIGSTKKLLRMQLDDDLADGWRSFLEVGREGVCEPTREAQLTAEAKEDDTDRVCQIFYTSGTSSGSPKGCPRTVQLVVNSLLARTSPTAAIERYVVNTVNFRAIAPSLTLAQWVQGGPCIMPSESFDPQTTLDAIEAHRAIFILLVPSMLYALRDHASTPSRQLGSVRRVILAGDMITRDTMMTAQQLLPKARVVNSVGMTEGVVTYQWPFDGVSVNQLPYHGDICPVGKVPPGVRIRLWDNEGRCVVRRGETGELHICSNRFIDHYLDHAHPEAFYNDASGRWFKTGDLGFLTDDGLFYVLGRTKDVIKRAGVNVVPAALENCINGFTGAQSSVIAIPSAKYGHEPFAVLDSLGGRTEKVIEQQVRDVFGESYALAGAVTLKQLGLDRFPVNSTDKIMKIELQHVVYSYLSQR